jgi:transcriptional regulator
MYVNPRHQFTDRDGLVSLIERHPLGAWVCQGRTGLIANHVPFLLDLSRGPLGTLVAHVARANPVWRVLDAAAPSVVMFRGPQAYITPSWYPGHAAHGEVVPTWNYVVAHVHGVARAVEDADRLLAIVNQLTDHHEGPRSTPWSMAEAPPGFIERLMRAIVGIEIPINRLEGKLKASQDEDTPDRHGTVQGLRAQNHDEAGQLADWVDRALKADEARPGLDPAADPG